MTGVDRCAQRLGSESGRCCSVEDNFFFSTMYALNFHFQPTEEMSQQSLNVTYCSNKSWNILERYISYFPTFLYSEYSIIEYHQFVFKQTQKKNLNNTNRSIFSLSLLITHFNEGCPNSGTELGLKGVNIIQFTFTLVFYLCNNFSIYSWLYVQ